MKTAEELKTLREKRKREEAELRLYKMVERERKRLEKAKKEKFKYSTPGRIMLGLAAFGQQLQEANFQTTQRPLKAKKKKTKRKKAKKKATRRRTQFPAGNNLGPWGGLF